MQDSLPYIADLQPEDGNDGDVVDVRGNRARTRKEGKENNSKLVRRAPLLKQPPLNVLPTTPTPFCRASWGSLHDLVVRGPSDQLSDMLARLTRASSQRKHHRKPSAMLLPVGCA